MGDAAPPKYAAKTAVPIDRTKAEIELLLMRYGATGFVQAWQAGRQTLSFEMAQRMYRFDFVLCTEADIPRHDRNGNKLKLQNLPGKSVQGAVDQANRTRWRELFLGIKAKLVLVEAGVTTLEEEFLAHVVCANGFTVYENLAPQLKQIYSEGRMPRLLPGGTD